MHGNRAHLRGYWPRTPDLKSEEVHLWEYRTMEDVQKRIPYFIEAVYNHKRLHSSLGYRPPCEFEAMITLTQNPCQSTLITSL